MVIGVPDRDPPHPQVIPPRRQAETVHVGLGDVPPLGVAQVAVDQHPRLGVLLRRDDQVVDQLLVRTDPGGRQRLLEQRHQPTEVPPAPLPHYRLQHLGLVEPADHPRIDVRVAPPPALLLRRPRRIQVAHQPADPAPPRRHLPDHSPLPQRLPAGFMAGAAPAVFMAGAASAARQPHPPGQPPGRPPPQPAPANPAPHPSR